MNLDGIKVLWRQSDTMALYGIPYDMRPGQQPADLTRGSPALGYGTYGAPYRAPGPRADWVWLGSPGWFGSLSPADISAVRSFLGSLVLDSIPTGPNEWAPVERLPQGRKCGCGAPEYAEGVRLVMVDGVLTCTDCIRHDEMAAHQSMGGGGYD